MEATDVQIVSGSASEVRNNPFLSDACALLLCKEDKPREAWIGSALRDSIQRLYDKEWFTAQPKQLERLPTHGLIASPCLFLLGLGEGPAAPHALRRAGVRLAREAVKRGVEALDLPVSPQDGAGRSILTEDGMRALVEGLLLGNYRSASYRRDQEEPALLKRIRLVVIADPGEAGSAGSGTLGETGSTLPAGPVKAAPAGPAAGTGAGNASAPAPDWAGLRAAAALAQIYADATNYARDLTNLPGNRLTPDRLADEAVNLAQSFGLEHRILEPPEMESLGMGGLLAVSQGSVCPPRMIVLKYQGRPEWSGVLGLVGKGITFDTGGISLKKAAGMEEMISDMGGAAVIMGVMRAAGRLRLPVNLLAVIPAAENMPSGAAYKPGDIITTLSGRTIEVLNTDAEGRIVLADGMTFARQLGADRLIDVATLTGAVLVHFGDVATAAITNDEPFLQSLLDASRFSGEKLWQLPVYEEYKEMLKSATADLNNSPGKWASCITAGLFVGAFAEDSPWIHLDTGGTAWLWKERDIDPKGGTGAMVRTLLEMVRNEARAGG